MTTRVRSRYWRAFFLSSRLWDVMCQVRLILCFVKAHARLKIMNLMVLLADTGLALLGDIAS
jgi:hypothetical protein